MTSLFASSAVARVVESRTYKSGIYHYTVTQTMDSSNCNGKVTVESNKLNRDYELVMFKVLAFPNPLIYQFK
jgi:hypothetical protein